LIIKGISIILLWLKFYQKLRNMLNNFPSWVLIHKGKGKEIRCIKGNYYLYQVKCLWNKERKRPQKITESFLGRITESGLVKGERIQKDKTKITIENISIKEYGIASFLLADNNDVFLFLKNHFTAYETIFCAAFNRFVHHSPLKNMEHHYHVSYLSEMLPNASMNDKLLSALLLQIGSNRPAISAFMKQFMQKSIPDQSFLLLDATQVLSLSSTMNNAQVGYNSKGSHDPQVSILYLFSADAQMPAFYRIVPGNIKEVAAMSLTIEESQVQNSVLVADKGFFSATNLAFLVQKKMQYIIPLRRSSSLIDYTPCEVGQRKGFSNYLRFNDRIIWYFEKKATDNQRIILFLDEDLRRTEQHDYLQRIEKEYENYSLEMYHLKAKTHGTIALLTNLTEDKSPEQVYVHYKSRAAIEILFDTFKNILSADTTYMRSNESMEAWLFINHLALIFYYRLYKRLIQYKLLKKYSPKDIIMHLDTIKKVKINDNWLNAEIPSKSKTILQKIQIPIT
jgi:transposase